MYIVYGKPNCGMCQQAKSLLESKDSNFKYVDVSEDQVSYNFLVGCGHRSVPQIYLADREGTPCSYVGGFNELKQQLAA